MLAPIDQFPGNSRVWVYQADRLLTSTEQQWALEQLAEFVPQWANHGKALSGTATILNDAQIVLVVNEAMVGASGCSIDSSVRFIKALGAELNVDFFNRFKLLTLNEGKPEFIHYNDKEQFKGRTYFNTLIHQLEDIEKDFIKEIV